MLKVIGTMTVRAHLSLIALVLFLCTLLSSSYAQTYNTSLGLRLGDGIGMSLRQRLIKRTSVEGIFYKHHKSEFTIAGGMLDHHMPIISKRFNLYAGGGFGRVFREPDENAYSSFNSVMLNAGIEFTISRLNMSWDFVPVIPVGNTEESLTTMTAFSIRYVVIKKDKKGLFENKNSGKHNKKKHKKHRRRR